MTRCKSCEDAGVDLHFVQVVGGVVIKTNLSG